jgi:hypothetical protein
MSRVALESTAPSLGRNYNNIVIIRHTYLCVNQTRPTTNFEQNWKLVKKQKKYCHDYDYTNGKTVILFHVIFQTSEPLCP